MPSQPHRLVIGGGQVLTPAGFEPGTVLTDGASITAVEVQQSHPEEPVTGSAATAVPTTTIDATDLVVSPGFIDLQINGGFGLDLATEPEAVWELGRQLPQFGVTAFCPTVISSPPPVTDRMLGALAALPADYTGATPLGAHLEGPMLNPLRCGAHQKQHLRTPEPSIYRHWSAKAGVAMVTLAPELSGATAAIEALASVGVVISGGHSNATADEGEAAADAGMSMVTHLWNAMAPIGHREPNLAGFALTDDRISTGLIVDGVHVDPRMVDLAWQATGPNRCVLVSDAVAAMGLGPGRHQLGGRTVVADQSSVRTLDGTLAGTNLTIDAAVRNLMLFTGAELSDAVTAVTRIPARILGLADRGTIATGKRADFVLLDDQQRVAVTVCAGQTVFVVPEHTWRLTTDR